MLRNLGEDLPRRGVGTSGVASMALSNPGALALGGVEAVLEARLALWN